MNQLRDKWNQWNDCLNGGDVNSIANQLARMTWDITAFRVLVEAHQSASEGDATTRRFNGFPFHLLHKCFSESLLFSFRRLMDGYGLDGKQGVYSLRSLLDDLISYSHLLTREAVVRVTSEALEPASGQQDDDFVRDAETSRNITIDQVIGVEENSRSHRDRIPKKIFKDKRDKLVKYFKSVEILVNKLIAHAATPTSRENADSQPPCFEELYKFHEELCKTAHFIQGLITNEMDLSFLPTISPGREEYEELARPLISDADIPRLEQRWQEFADQYKSWSG